MHYYVIKLIYYYCIIIMLFTAIVPRLLASRVFPLPLFLAIGPPPVSPFGGVGAFGISVILALELLILELLPRSGSLVAKCLAIINRQHRKSKTIHLVPNGKLEWSVNVTLLLVASDVHQVLARATVGETVDEPGVRVEVEHDGLVVCEDGLVLAVGETMRMIAVGNDCAVLVIRFLRFRESEGYA